MPIDTNIAMGYNPTTALESPLNVMAKVQALRGAQQENQLNQMKMAEYQRGIADRNALRSTLAGFTPDMSEADQVSALQRGGYLTEARTLAESHAKVSKDRRDEEKASLEAELKRINIRAQVFGSVAKNPTIENAQGALDYLLGNKLVDPAKAQQVRQQIQTNPTPENISGLATQFLNMGLSAQEQMTARHNELTAAETERSHRATEAATIRGQNITAETTRRGQDISAETTRRGQDQAADVDLQRRLAEARKAGETSAGKAPGVTSPEAARAFLASAGFDEKTGQDEVSKLIPKSTGGLLQTGGAKIAEAFNVTTSGQAALGKLASRSSKLVLDLLGGKLGAGVSNADREFMLQAVGDIGNSTLSTGKRLAAWTDLRNRMKTLAGGTSTGSSADHSQKTDAEILAELGVKQ